MSGASGTGKRYRAVPKGVTIIDEPRTNCQQPLAADTERGAPRSESEISMIAGGNHTIMNTQWSNEYTPAYARIAYSRWLLLAAVAVFVVPVQIEELVALLHGAAGVQIIRQLPQGFRRL